MKVQKDHHKSIPQKKAACATTAMIFQWEDLNAIANMQASCRAWGGIWNATTYIDRKRPASKNQVGIAGANTAKLGERLRKRHSRDCWPGGWDEHQLSSSLSNFEAFALALKPLPWPNRTTD